MKQNKLTLRQKNIILLLINSINDKSITISKIAENLKLSSRTVLREIPSIEKWFEENDFNFMKKPGVGLIVSESLENKELIRELLEVEKIQKEFSKDEIRKIILFELIINKEPLKLFYFTSILKISEASISNYLDDLEVFLRQFSINLIRRQGIGIYLEGNEESYRKVLSNILYSFIDENKMIEVIENLNKNKLKEKKFSIESKLLGLVDENTIDKIKKTLEITQREYGFTLSDSSYIGLIIHLALATKRITDGEKIVMDKDILQQLEQLDEFNLSEKITENISKEFDIKIPKDEVGYITMHLKGAKLTLSNLQNEISLANLNVMEISKVIIKSVEDDFGVEIQDRETLCKDLSNHLVPAISRLSMGLNIRNPLLEEIKENYYNVYKSCEKASSILKKITKITEIPQSEIAYIAIHIAASLEKVVSKRKVSVVIVCPTGIGASRLLATKIGREFDNINIKGTISAINIDIENLKLNGIDFIISTVNLEIDYKYLLISPVLTEIDKLKLKEFLKDIYLNTLNYKSSFNDNEFNLETIKNIGEFSRIIASLIESINVKKIDYTIDFDDVVKIASGMFAESYTDKLIIKNDLLKREEISTTYLDDYKIMFLHCQTEGIRVCQFGVIQFEKTVNLKNKDVDFVTVSLLPMGKHSIQTEVMSKITEELLENNEFRLILKLDNKEVISKKLENKLSVYFKEYLLNFMEE